MAPNVEHTDDLQGVLFSFVSSCFIQIKRSFFVNAWVFSLSGVGLRRTGGKDSLQTPAYDITTFAGLFRKLPRLHSAHLNARRDACRDRFYDIPWSQVLHTDEITSDVKMPQTQ